MEKCGNQIQISSLHEYEGYRAYETKYDYRIGNNWGCSSWAEGYQMHLILPCARHKSAAKKHDVELRNNIHLKLGMVTLKASPRSKLAHVLAVLLYGEP
jgi:hypothetical protein